MPRWPAGLHQQSASRRNTGQRRYSIPSTPQEAYTHYVSAELTNAAQQATVNASGKATVIVQPQGLGTRWYLTQISGSTTTGPLDTSTVAVYIGAQTQANLLGGNTLSGGQFTIGVNNRPVTPGDLITAVWTGAKAGDTASLVPYGVQYVLA